MMEYIVCLYFWTRNALDCANLMYTPRALFSLKNLTYRIKHDVDRMTHCRDMAIWNLQDGGPGGRPLILGTSGNSGIPSIIALLGAGQRLCIEFDCDTVALYKFVLMLNDIALSCTILYTALCYVMLGIWVLLCKLSYSQFCVEIRKFSLLWQQGSVWEMRDLQR